MELKEFFEQNPKAAIAFSGGVDSAYLLYAAVRAGADVTAYYVNADFQPAFELEDAQRLAKELGAKLRVIPMSVLGDEAIVSNPANRCYFCKRQIFGNILKAAAEDGYTVICDGTNASDQVSDRPGMKALKELEVRSPLRECGLVKDRIRELSKEAGLFTWNKPTYACLATRIPTGVRIEADMLEATEKAEAYLTSLGFRDFRVRMNFGEPSGLKVIHEKECSGCGTQGKRIARLQILEPQAALLREKEAEIAEELSNYYDIIALDPVFRTVED